MWLLVLLLSELLPLSVVATPIGAEVLSVFSSISSNLVISPSMLITPLKRWSVRFEFNSEISN